MPIYLDNSATTQVRQEVLEAMQPYLTINWGNPSSVHKLGHQSQKAINIARDQIATLLNCLPEEIYFTPCGTYSNNIAIIGRARFASANDQGKHMITTQIEHAAVLGPAKYLESLGWQVTYLPVDKEGLVNSQDLKSAIKSDTSIISVMWANNEIGTIEPINELTSIAKNAGVYFHTDAIQIIGKAKIDLSVTQVDTLSLSGHKFYAPKGIGALFIRKGTGVMPLIFGGGQERGLFPGTENLANIIALGKAAELANLELNANIQKLKKLQKTLIDQLLSSPFFKLTGAQDMNKRLPGHVSVINSECDGEALVMRADLKDICISSGSACHVGIIEPSSVLLACGYNHNEALSSARISAGIFNQDEECKLAATILTETVRSVSLTHK